MKMGEIIDRKSDAWFNDDSEEYLQPIAIFEGSSFTEVYIRKNRRV